MNENLRPAVLLSCVPASSAVNVGKTVARRLALAICHRNAKDQVQIVYEQYLEGTVEVAPAEPELVASIQRNKPQDDCVLIADCLQSVFAFALDLKKNCQSLEEKKLLFIDFCQDGQKKRCERRVLRIKLSE